MAIFSFGEFEADEDRFELRRRGRGVRVQRLILETIFYFLRSGGKLITKRELARATRPGARVSNAAVSRAIIGIAAADTIPANMGKAAIGSQTNLFNYDLATGAVTASGLAGLRSWQLGLPLDIFGPKLVTVTSRATSLAFAPRWRIVTNNAVDTAFAASAFAPIPVSGSFVPATRAAFVLPFGVCFIDARMNAGARIATVNYNM